MIGKLHCDVLKLMRENVRRKRPEMWRSKYWFLLQRNTPVHTSLVVGQFFLFSEMKLQLKGRRLRFDSVNEIQAESQDVRNDLTSADFQNCFQSYQGCWNRNINVTTFKEAT